MNNVLSRKILEPEALAQTLREVRAAGLSIVQCHGCFDLVHPGHIRYLQAARAQGDVLVVSLTADDGVQKGPERPYIPQDLRAENLAALEFVDWVVIDPHPTAVELLDLLRPDVYVKGYEYARSHDPRFLRERETVEAYGGRVVYHSDEVVFSSTRLLESMQRDAQLEQMRLRTLLLRRQVTLAAVREALAGFRGKRVLVIGDALRERIVLGDARQTAGDAPILSLQEIESEESWAGAAALALHLANLGAQPQLLTSLGEDEASELLQRSLIAAGVEVHAIAARSGLPERTTYQADQNKLLQVCRGACFPLDSAGERMALTISADLLPASDALLMYDLGLGTLTPGLVAHLGSVGRSGGKVTIAAVGARGDAAALGGADLLIGAERSLREAEHDHSSSLPAVIWNLLRKTSSTGAVAWLPRRGLMAFDEADGAPRLRTEYFPALTHQARDLAGVEEALVAVAALTRAGGGTLTLAAYLAALADALIAAQPGPARIALEQLDALATQRPELASNTHFVPAARRAALPAATPMHVASGAIPAIENGAGMKISPSSVALGAAGGA